MKVNREWRSKQTTKKKMDEVEKEEIQLDMEDQEGEESEETCSAQGENPMVITGDTRPNSKDIKFNELLEEFAFKKDVDDLQDSSVAPSWLDIDVDKSSQEQNFLTQRVTKSMTLNKFFFSKIDNKHEPSTFKEAFKHEC